MTRLTFVTGNANKLREVKQILESTPYSSWSLESKELDGLNQLLHGFEDKSATARCTFAFAPDPDHEPILFEGTTAGRIVPPRGENRFGWDPIFEVADTNKTFAEMGAAEKNQVSHRARALAKLQDYLAKTSSQ